MLSNKSIGRLYVVIQIILIASVCLFSIRDSNSIFIPINLDNVIGLVLLISGLVLMFLIGANFRQMMTPNPVPLENSHLRKSGFYKYIRHPMYSAALLTILGIVFYYRSISGFIIWLITVIFIIVKIRFEERMLNEKFTDYTSYSLKTKKLIPYIY